MDQKRHLKNNTNSLLYSDENSIQLMSDQITTLLPAFPREYIIVGIGTDRSTGDALGPLTGTYLTQMNLKHMTVLGTLHEPVHAQNLADYIKKINTTYRKPYIIAIDACLGRSSSIGKINIGTGPLLPGAALNKPLPAIGDLHITAVVNVGGYMEYAVLQNTRLSTVVDMAETIASTLNIVDKRLTTYKRRLFATVLPEFGDQDMLGYQYKNN